MFPTFLFLDELNYSRKIQKIKAPLKFLHIEGDILFLFLARVAAETAESTSSILSFVQSSKCYKEHRGSSTKLFDYPSKSKDRSSTSKAACG
jgi:hypothetical protein